LLLNKKLIIGCEAQLSGMQIWNGKCTDAELSQGDFFLGGGAFLGGGNVQENVRGIFLGEMMVE